MPFLQPNQQRQRTEDISERWQIDSDISWTICRSFALRSRQITTPATTSPFYSVRAALKACTHMTYNKTFYLVVIKEWKHSILQYEPAFREPCRQQYILFCIVNKPLSNVTRYLIPTWYVPSRLLYSTFANLLTVPWMRLAFSFCVCNSLDNITRDSQTVSTFKRHLKTHLFQSAFNIIL